MRYLILTAMVSLMAACNPSTPQPDFDLMLEASPSIAQGKSMAVQVKVERKNGFSSPLTISPIPPVDSGLSLPNALIAADASSATLHLSAALGAPVVARLILPVKVSGGGVEKSQNLTLSITPSDWFGLASPNLSLVKGQEKTLQLNLDRTLVKGEVRVNPEASPPNGLEVSPLTITSSANSAHLTLKATSNLAAGNYTLNLIAQGDGASQTRSLALTVSDPPPLSFDLHLGTANPSVVRGQTGALEVNLQALNGFVGIVNLSLHNAPQGITFSFNPDNLNGAIAGLLAPKSTLTLSVAPSVHAGLYSLILRGISGNQTVEKTLSLTVTDPPDFQIVSVNPSTLNLLQGANTSFIMTVNRTNLSDAIALTLPGLPSGVSQPTVSIAAGQTSAQITLTASDTAVIGNANLTVSATAGTLTRTSQVTLSVKAPFELSLSKTSGGAVVGDNDSLTVTLTRNFGYAGTVSLSLMGAPNGLNPSFNPASLSNAAIQSSLILQATNGIAPGTYGLKVRASNGRILAEKDFSFTVTPPVPTGKIWVLDKGNQRILGYSASDPNGSTPITLNLSAHANFGLQGLAFDGAGNLWFSRSASANGQPGEVLRIPAGSVGSSGSPTPDITITSNDFFYLAGLAFDNQGNLWVANSPWLLRFNASRLNANYSGPADLFMDRWRVFRDGTTNIVFDSNNHMWTAASAGDRDTDDDTRFNPPGQKCSDRTGALVKYLPNQYNVGSGDRPPMVVGDESTSEPGNPIYQGGSPCIGMNYDGRNTYQTTGVAVSPDATALWAANSANHPDEGKPYLSRFNLTAINANDCTYKDQAGNDNSSACWINPTTDKIACPEATSFPAGEQNKYRTPNGEWKCAATSRIYLSEKPWGMVFDPQGNLWVTTATKVIKFSAASLPTTGNHVLAPDVSLSGLSSPQGIVYR